MEKKSLIHDKYKIAQGFRNVHLSCMPTKKPVQIFISPKLDKVLRYHFRTGESNPGLTNCKCKTLSFYHKGVASYFWPFLSKCFWYSMGWMHDVFSRYTYFHIDVNNKSRDRDHTYSAPLSSEQLRLELQQTKDIEIVHQMQKKSNLTRLGFYVVWENVLNTPKLSIFACPDWIELDASRPGQAFIKKSLQKLG